MNLKKAPQKEVLSIERTGSWGNVEYRHRLACGHTEIRKRPSPKDRIACSWCVVAKEKNEELSALAARHEPEAAYEVPLEIAVYDADIANEVDAGLLRAGLVAALGCTPESVEVVLEVDEDGVLAARYVVVFLDLPTARRIAQVDGRTPLV